MTDPRFTDPDPRLSDPVVRRDDNTGGMWGWIAGVAVLVLIGFLIVAGWKNNGTTASSGASPSATANTPVRPASPPSTTGSGSSSTQPLTPAPSPAPSRSQ